MGRVGALVGRLTRTRAFRANDRLGEARGPILSAGIAFYGVFALFPLLVLGFTVLGTVVGRDAQLQQTVIRLMNESLPGGVIGPGDDAIVSAEDLLEQATDTTLLGLSALLGVGVLLYTGLGWIAALREGVRSMFELPPLPVDPVRAKLHDLAVMLTLGALIVASALATVAAQGFTEELLDMVGLQGSSASSIIPKVLVFTAGVLLNTLLFVVLYRVLGRATAPARTVVSGALVAAVGVALLQSLVGNLLGNVDRGLSFLSAFVPILALFVWLNLTARVMLFGAAWVAVGKTRRPAPETPAPAAAVQRSEAATPGRRREVAPPLRPALPVRWTDRAVLGAGVVLGASAVTLARLTGGALRAAGAGARSLARDD